MERNISVDDDANYTTTEPLTTPQVLYPYWMPPKWSLDVELAIMIVVFVIGVPGNALIIVVQTKSKNKTSTDYLVLIMAMYELIGSSVNVFLKVAYDIRALWLILNSAIVCKLTQATYAFVHVGSGQMLGMLAIDRCIKTVFPLNTCYGVGTALVVSAGILVVALVISVPQLVIQAWDPKTLQCALMEVHGDAAKYLGISGSGITCIVFFILSVSYTAIAVSLRRRHFRKVTRRKTTLDIISAKRTESTTTSNRTSISTVDYQVSTMPGGRTNEVSDSGYKATVEPNQPSQHNAPSTNPGINTTAKNAVLTLEGRNINKLTVLLFTISVVYVATNLFLWFLYVTSPLILGVGMLQLAFSIPMLNCIANPVMFICMSSRFRQNVMALFQ